MTSAQEAHAAVLTATGRGAIAVVRLWGRDVLALADSIFEPIHGSGLKQGPRGRPRVGRAGRGHGDEIVALVQDGSSPEVEFHCHAGPAAMNAVLDSIRSTGIEVSSVDRWVRSVNRSRIVTDAWTDVPNAQTLHVADILLDQAQGAWEGTTHAIEMAQSGQLDDVLADLNGILERSRIGLHLLSGWSVALVGRPNVGKSRLLNALAGFDRAIVAPSPGTTRDVLTVRTAVRGWPIELADTAGLRTSLDPIEVQGVHLAHQRHREADLLLVVLDRSQALTAEDQESLALSGSVLRVANKCDLPSAWDHQDLGALPISAATGAGVAQLLDAIANWLVPKPISDHSALPFRPEHVRRLERIRTLIANGRIEAARRALAWLTAPGAR